MLVYEDAESDDEMAEHEDGDDSSDGEDYGEEEIKQIPIVKKRAKLAEMASDDDGDLYGDEDEDGESSH